MKLDKARARAMLVAAAVALFALGLVFTWIGAEGATAWEKAVWVVNGALWVGAAYLVAWVLAWVLSAAWRSRDLWAGGGVSGMKE